ncbi:transcription factor bHLH110-like isoform X2 [Prosopis cineraria]|uniref:transcription factor bHLH110-like isoform X2 n=1 Tax=Prosopis cineraria TaxID=364024 RepID=UPI00240FD9DF|nr:transcription factor bHLH110-like isoform X2 [Prosopis cineraria]
MDYRDFRLQHQLQEHARYNKPSIACEAWNSSNSCNGYGSSFAESRQSTEIYLREKGQEDYFDRPQRSSGDGVLNVVRIKDEVSKNYLPRLCEMMISSLSSACANNDSPVSSPISKHSHVTAKEIWPAGNYDLLCHLQKRPIDGGAALSNKTTSYNTFGAASSSSSSNLSAPEMSPSSLLSCSLDSSSQMLLGGSSRGLGLSCDALGLDDDVQRRENSPSNSSNKFSASVSGVAGAKTSRSCSQLKEYEAKAKSRPSCPPLKVRKERLGDRIQALQKLVAPSGKTNTASVLDETVGYIHFLHGQIQTLSISYMKSSKTKRLRTLQDFREEKSRESKPDLRSRGLCLVPLSYASYIHNLD